jgi:DNA polymerase III epsilon subunit family exonuclease
MSDRLESLFHIDRSDPSTGIKISLKKPGTSAHPGSGGDANRELSLPISVSPIPRFSYTPEAVHIVNGRVVRESRHADSAYYEWAPVIGPSDVDVAKPVTGRKKAVEPHAPLETLEYAVVDVETTGGGQTRGHRITEIAIVRVDANGRKTHEFSTLINPGRAIPTAITQITNIDYDMVRVAPRFEDVAHQVRALLEGRVFVAHNAAFDWSFIHGELVRTTGKPLLGRRLCTVRLARKVVPEVRRRSLDALSYFFDVHNEARHRAYGDARATALILRRLLERVWERDIDTWQKLDRFVRAPKPKQKRSALPTAIEDV